MKIGALQTVSSAALAIALAVSPAQAQVTTWLGGTVGAEQDWSTGTNWSGGVPASGSDARIDGAASPSVSLSAGAGQANILRIGTGANGLLQISNGASLETNTGMMGSNAGSSGVASITGAGTNWTSEWLFLGLQGAGTLDVSDGAHAESAILALGANPTGSGFLTISGGGSVATNSAVIGDQGIGNVIVNGGALTAAALSVGNYAGATGNVILVGPGSSLTSSSATMVVGGSGSGYVNVWNGASVLSSGTLNIGTYAGSHGEVVVSGAGSSIDAASTTSAAMILGDRGTGVLNISDGGTVNVVGGSGTLRIASQSGSAAELRIGGNGAAAAAGSLNAQNVVFGAGEGAILFNHTDADYQFAANILGSGSIQQLAGTTRLLGLNSYTGGTTITGGRLIGDSDSLTGSISLNYPGHLEFDQASDGIFAGQITGFGDVTKSGAGQLTLAGGNSVRSLSVTEGSLLVSADLSSNSGKIDGELNPIVKVSGSAASWASNGLLNVGDAAQGTLQISGGGQVSSRAGVIGGLGGSVGHVTIEGAGSQWSSVPGSGPLTIGQLGAAYVDIEDGGALYTQGANIATFGSGKGVVTLSGAGSTWQNNGSLVVGQVGAGQGSGNFVNVLDGAALATDQLLIGGDDNFNGSGIVQVSGADSSLVARTAASVGHGGVGTLVVADGGVVDVEAAGISGAGILSVGLRPGSVGTLAIGAMSDEAAQAAGLVKASAIVLGSSFDRIVLNHTDDAYVLSSTIAGAGSLNVYGGTSSLTGSNSYTGGTFIRGGVLEIASEGALGTGAVEIGGGSTPTATLRFAADTDFTRDIYLATNTSRLDVGDHDVILSGDISSGATVSLQKNGAGSLTLRGTNSYLGNTWLNEGSLIGDADSFANGFIVTADDTRLILDEGSDTIFANQIRGTGTFVKRGLGTVDLTAENGFSGGMVVEAGILTTSVTGAFGAGTVDVHAGAGARVGGVAEAGHIRVSNDGDFSFEGEATGAQARIVNAATGQLFIDDLASAGTSIGSVSGEGSVVLGSKSLTLGGLNQDDVISGVISGSGGSLVKTGSGALTLSGANTYSGGTTLLSGTLGLGHSGALGSGGLVMAGGTTLDYLVSGDFGDEVRLVLDGNAKLNVGSGLTVNQNGALLGTGGFEKTGAGTLHLWSPVAYGFAPSEPGNSYEGDTTVSAGQMVLHGPNAISDLSGVTVASGAGMLLSSDYYGNGETIGSLAGAGLVDLGTRELITGGNGRSTIFSGNIQGTGTLVKTGAGAMTLASDQSYTGPTFVEGGRLTVNGALASGYVGVDDGASLGGAGTIAGDVFVNSGGGILGTSGQTLTMNDLTLGAGSMIDANLASPSETGLLRVNGDLRLNGATLNVISAGGTALDAGVYRVIEYGGALYNNTPLGISSYPSSMALGDLGIQTAVAGQVNLVSAQGLTLNFWDGSAAANLNNGIVDGGDGLWSASAHSWTDMDGAVTLTRATNAMAVFQGAAGHVTVDGTIATNGIQFAVDGYDLAGGILDIGAGNTIRVGDGTAEGAAYGAVIGSTIQGNGTLAKTDLGTLTLTGDNSYEGGTVIYAGTLVGSSGSLGSGDILTAGALVIDQDDNGTLAQDISGLGTLTKTGSGTLALTGANSYHGGTTLNGGGIVTRTTGALGTGNVNVLSGLLSFEVGATAGSLGIANDGTVEFADTASAANAQIANRGQTSFWNDASGGDALIVNSNGGDTNFFDTSSAGTANISNSGAGSEVWFFDAATAGSASLTNDGGRLIFRNTSSAGQASINNVAGTIIFADASSADEATITHGGGTLSLANLTTGGLAIGSLDGAGAVNLADKTLTLGGLNADNLLSGAISGEGGSLVKIGTGTLTLEGVNDYSGTTLVSSGSLKVDGSIATGATVADGATLSGTGTLAGTVTIADGGHLAGRAGQTLNLGALALSAGSIVDLEIGAPTQVAAFDVAGDLTLDGTLNMTRALDFMPGVTRLFDYGGALVDNGLEIGSVPEGLSSHYQLQTAVLGQVNLVNAAGLTLNFWDGSAVDHLSNGQIDGGDGIWSLEHASWTDADGLVSKSMQPQPGFAIFGGAAGTVTVDNIQGAVVTAGMQFASDGYLLQGDALTLGEAATVVRVGAGTATDETMVARIDAQLTGSGGLTKTGAGTLLLASSNDFTGGTTIGEGTVVGTGGSFGSGAIVNEARLVLAQESDGTLANDLSGSGSFVKAGAGTLTYSGDGHAYDGTTSIEEGTLLLTGSLGGSSQILAGATLQVGDGAAAGDLLGATRNDGRLIFARSDDYDYEGALSGAGSLIKRGDGLLTLSGEYSYTGSTVVEAGRIALNSVLDPATNLVMTGGSFELGDQHQEVSSLSGTGGTIAIGSSGQLTVNQSVNSEFAGGFTGSGTFVKTGDGRLNLTGNSQTFTGSTLVQGGRLAVNGALGGLVGVSGTGSIGGNGTIGGLVVQNGGTAAPGNSIGLLHVAGNVTFEAGSIFEVEASPDLGTDGFGIADRIEVAGTAAIEGGTVQVVAEGSNYAPETTYKILSANGGVTGTFEGSADNYAYLDSWLSYDQNNVFLSLMRNDIDFAAAVSTPNQKSTASAVEALGFTNEIYRAAIRLSETEAGNAFDQLSGEIHMSATTALYEDSRQSRSAVLARMSNAHQSGVGFWMQNISNWGKSDGNRNSASVDRDTTGALLGVDIAAGDHWTLGVAGGWTQTDLRSSAGSGKIESANFLGYAGAQYGRARIKMGLGYSTADLDLRRQISFTGFQDSASARHDGDVYQAFGEIGYALPLSRGEFEPFANLTTVKVKTDAFSESGGPASLAVDKRSDTFTSSTIGARLATPATGLVAAKAMLGWRHVYGDTVAVGRNQFAGGLPFAVSGAPISRDAGLFDAEAMLRLTPAITLSATYNGMIGTTSVDHSVAGRISFRF
ncbi:autotransporter-associated beta strand repeat-containing protein [Sphingobium sp. TKS]|uniref:autotransporter-associated beta strand repeat-containing protein n=1 Tax=Sphingobium sp. TKS TaxID=1315974 RepID=UPI00077033F0|nr:autotransporter-associated beta strand repeat-containing protein [Sphingobium sp. TKS]AMK26098.1 outer membrane autotransporter barrel domain-containing protein [Sphingobium sp. TKS]